MRFFWTFISLLALTACTMTHEITFNKNFSGKVNTDIDFSQMGAMSGSTDSLKVLDDPENVAKMAKLKAIEGISNVTALETSPNIYHIEYEFKNVKALNESLRLIYATPDASQPVDYVTQKGKKELEFNIPAMPSEEGEDMETMGDMFVYKLKLNFKGKIKSYVTSCEKVVQNGNSLEIETNVTELSKKDQKFITTIKF